MDIRSFICIAAPAVIFFSCSKETKPAKGEAANITLSGTVLNCGGKPATQTRITIWAIDQEAGWLSNSSKSIATLTTDMNGNFSTPVTEFPPLTDYFLITATDTNQVYGYDEQKYEMKVNIDSIKSTGLSDYHYNLYIRQFGTLKVVLNNVSPAAAGDKLYFNDVSYHNACPQDNLSYYPIWYNVNEMPITGVQHNYTFSGKIFVGDSIRIAWQVEHAGVLSDKQYFTVYCPSEYDLVEYQLDY